MRSATFSSVLLVCCYGFLHGFAQSYYGDSGEINARCFTPNGEETICVDVWKCKPILDLLKTLRRPHPLPISKKLNEYRCGDGHQVCCHKGPVSLGLGGVASNTQELFHDREVAPDVSTHKNFGLLPENCGYFDTTIRITKGENAYLNEFPWMALLQYKTAKGLDFMCGGTIINYNYILTAAHCLRLKDGELVGVRVGEYSLSNDTDCEVQNDRKKTLKCNPPVQDLKIEEIIAHHQFEVKTKNVISDIALLRVSRMKKADNVYPVCLPVAERRDSPYRNVIVTGWGLTNSQTQERADILQRVELPIADKKVCSATYSESGIELTKTQVCAGGVNGKASCSGDSGGPMLGATVIDGNFMYVQHGVVSIGPSFCGIRGYPGVYTLVKFYMDWILDNMKP